MNKVYILIFIMSFTNINSQELLFERDVKLKSFFNEDKKESFPVVNYDSKEIAMFLLDKKEIKSFLFDMNYVLIDSFATTRPKGKYDILLGHTFENDNYNLIFTNENKTKFFIKSINIGDKHFNHKELEIKIKGEKFLESFSYKNNLYIITIKNSSSILNIYEFKGREITRIEKIDLSNHKFSKSSRSLSYVLFNNTSAKREYIILNKIDNKNPNPIDLSSYANKIYCYNNKMFITLDVYQNYTKVISINLSNFESNVFDFKFPEIDCKYDVGVNSNSFLLGDKIYQVSGCKNELYFSISNINSKVKLKEWNVKKNEIIDFKNTPLIQLGGAFNKNKKYKELSETKQILRKMGAGNIGVSAYKVNDKLEITIGGFKKMNTKEIIGALAAAGAMTAGAKSSSGFMGSKNSNYYYNSTMYTYQNYSYARSIYFKSLLNEELENITGSINENAFDKIREYNKNHQKELSTETIFKVDDYYVLGYYDKKEVKYYLLKFKEY